MGTMKMPERVKEHLLPDEDVTRRFSSIWKEFYATNKRVIGFERPDWVVMFLVLGLLPGILALLLTRKTYLGAIEYSRISGVSRKLSRTVLIVALGLVIGLPLIIMGIVVLTTAPEPSNGWVLLILGLFILALCLYFRPSAYQFEIRDLPKNEARKWFFGKAKGLSSKSEADKFAQLIVERTKS